jgi:hypothetical protein
MVRRRISQKDPYYAVKPFKSSNLENRGEIGFSLEEK